MLAPVKQTTSNGLSGNNNGLNNNFNNNANNNPYAKLKQWLGQSEQNINSALYPKPQGDDANSYQLAQNNKTNTGNLTRTDVNFDDNSLKERMIPVIKKMEKPLDYIYIDTTWNKTTGAGANVDDWNTFNKVNWELNGRSATEEEKRATFDYFDKITSKGKQNVDEKGKLLEKNNNQADFYSNKSQLRISSNETDRLLRDHLAQDTKYLQREFPDFASYPPELQNVLLDIKFNTGNVSQENWPKLRKAIAEKNLFGDEGILKNVHRKDVGKDRNDWAEQQIRNILYWQ